MRNMAAVLVAISALTGAALAGAGPAGAATARPAVSAVAPNNGSTLGGTRFTLTGSHFSHVRSVSFGRLRGTAIRVLSSTRLQVSAPAHVAGTVDVTVRTSIGTSTLRRADHYLYVSPPAVTALSSTSGDAAGGVPVTVTGRGFIGVTAVRFGMLAGFGVKVLSSTRLQVTAPAHPSGTYDVRVTNRYGTSVVTTLDRYHYATSFSAPAAIGLNATLPVTAHGLRPGTHATVGLDDGAYPLADLLVNGWGTVAVNAVTADLVPDGTHQVQLAGVDGVGAPVTFAAAVLVDSVAPTIGEVTISAGSVHPGDTITFTAHVLDDGGAQTVVMHLGHPGLPSPCAQANAALQPDSTPQDGIWSLTCVLPDTAAEGTYEVEPWASDVVGNWTVFPDTPPTFTITPAP